MNRARATAMGAIPASGLVMLLVCGCFGGSNQPSNWAPPRSTVQPKFGGMADASTPTDAAGDVPMADVVSADVASTPDSATQVDAADAALDASPDAALDASPDATDAATDTADADVAIDAGQGDVADSASVGCPDDCPKGPKCQSVAKLEVCNGKDDNCDGQTDNGTCDDGNQCSLDACDAVAGCAHVPVPDSKACEGDKICSGGACKAVGGQPVSPTPGSLVITELMANPASVNDSVGEWFEVHNPGPNPIKIGVLIIADASGIFTIVDNSLIIQSGGWFVFGRNMDVTKNGGVPVNKVYGKVSLNNASGDTLRLQLAGGAIIDQVVYTPGTNGWPKLGNGASYQLDPTKLNTTANDLGASWCMGKTTFGAGDLGTPGKPNGSCP